MAGWVVSAHGTYESMGEHKIFLNGKTVYMYVDDNRILYNSKAWPIFNNLTGPLPDLVKARGQAYRFTDWVWNYVATGTTDFPSGIFETGKSSATIPLANGERATLGQILDSPDCPNEVFWLCCTCYDPKQNVGLMPTSKAL